MKEDIALKFEELKIVPERQVFSVSEITRNIRFALENAFSGVWIEGEVSNFKWHTSGHMYFSLKDEAAQIQCVMFRRENNGVSFEMKEGLAVMCFGRVSVYAVRGQYQLYVDRIEPKGVGALQLRFEQLKEKLRNEGLFDESRKKPVPYLPSKIGVVTSIDGAALRDILHVLNRRFSSAHISIYPAAVQGAGAAAQIAEAIEDLNRWQNVDVMILARGGGSLEDLWAFNEEILARAIAASEIPVISAVGHEVDFTIADFVADLRAPTPSAAAEIVMPLKDELVERLERLKLESLEAMLDKIAGLREDLERLSESRAFREPLGMFEAHAQKLDELGRNLKAYFENFLSLKKERFLSLAGKLEALGPLATLKRGFSVSLKLPDEKVLVDVKNLKPGDLIKTKLSRGFFISSVREIHN